jgi:hypothetical protein
MISLKEINEKLGKIKPTFNWGKINKQFITVDDLSEALHIPKKVAQFLLNISTVFSSIHKFYVVYCPKCNKKLVMLLDKGFLNKLLYESSIVCKTCSYVIDDSSKNTPIIIEYGTYL